MDERIQPPEVNIEVVKIEEEQNHASNYIRSQAVQIVKEVKVTVKDKMRMDDSAIVETEVEEDKEADMKRVLNDFDPVDSANIIEVLFNSTKKNLCFLSDLLHILNEGEKGYYISLCTAREILEKYLQVGGAEQNKEPQIIIMDDEQLNTNEKKFTKQLELFKEYIISKESQEKELLMIFEDNFFKLIDDIKAEGNVTSSEINLLKTEPIVNLTRKIANLEKKVDTLVESVKVKSSQRALKLVEKRNHYKMTPLKNVAFDDPWITKQELNFFNNENFKCHLEYLKFYFKIQEKFLHFEKRVINATKEIFMRYAEILKKLKESEDCVPFINWVGSLDAFVQSDVDVSERISNTFISKQTYERTINSRQFYKEEDEELLKISYKLNAYINVGWFKNYWKKANFVVTNSGYLYGYFNHTFTSDVADINNVRPNIVIDLLCCTISVNDNLEIQLIEYRQQSTLMGRRNSLKHLLKSEQVEHLCFFEALSKFINTTTQENLKTSATNLTGASEE
ncbi:hypothetical protein HK099_005693 [Clydaea vesicula]|uniref:Uncharacterized protein n=1 Tax=Clydaea vesicula TaxID=447962 RepID=A0AAD5U255_9FUNG|nr:hypothetical protein HK099_005693 [Clydaea vesicula]